MEVRFYISSYYNFFFCVLKRMSFDQGYGPPDEEYVPVLNLEFDDPQVRYPNKITQV